MSWYWKQQQQSDGVALEEDSGFGRPFWSRSLEKSKEEEVECILKPAPVALGAGAAGASGLNVKRSGVFVEVFKYR